jgi:DNA polymerase-3 subunit epsilon
MTYIAVVDVETTGINPYRHNRIVELAVVVMKPDGTVVREFVTLVNPDRDMGPTRIHGLTSTDVIAAPRFSDIIGQLIQILGDCVVIAGHNVRFDHSFMSVEFERAGYTFPDAPTLCTMQLAGGGSLGSVCSDYGIEFDGDAHSAQHDARATAGLLATLLADAPHLTSEISCLSPIPWPKAPPTSSQTLTRTESRKRAQDPPTYIQALLTRVQPALPNDDAPSNILAYTALLTHVLEDRHVDEHEGMALIDLAIRWSITPEQIEKAHWDYLFGLAAAALADNVVTSAERRDLTKVATLLGLRVENLDLVLDEARLKLVECEPRHAKAGTGITNGDLIGRCVCFTGECQCRLKGAPITRDVASQLATECGLLVTESVTKKLDVLVVADPLSQSGKAKKARRYGIRVLHEPVFWSCLGVQVE